MASIVTTGHDERHDPLVSESRGFIQANQKATSAPEHSHASRTGHWSRLLHRRYNKCEVGSDFRVGMRGISKGSEAHASQGVILDSDVGGAPAEQSGVGWREMAAEPPIGSDTPFVAATDAGDDLVREESGDLVGPDFANREIGDAEVLVGSAAPVGWSHPAPDDCTQTGEQRPDSHRGGVRISAARLVHELEKRVVVAGADRVDSRLDVRPPTDEACDGEFKAASGCGWDRRSESNGAWFHVRTVHPGRPGSRPGSAAAPVEAQLVGGVGK